MIKTLVAVSALSLLPAAQAAAFNDLLNSVWGAKGNDTGGIIPWTPDNELHAFDIAKAQCATWNKHAVATSIHRIPGDYIGYKCVWDQARNGHRVGVKIDK